jgi:hypothetical protein
MATGPSATNANALVDAVTGAGGGGWLQFHIGDPGGAGTNNQAGSTTRIAVSYPAASAGTTTQSGTATLASWAGGSQTLTHASLWSASSGGTFRGSFPFAASRSVVNGDSLNVAGATWSCTAAA